jgi:uncharacterized membrane protein YhfC
MLYITFPLAILIDLLVPVALAVWLTRSARRTGKEAWLLVGVGVLTFIGSQVVHIPLNWLLGKAELISNNQYLIIRTAVVLGLSAGLCEETARAVGYWLLKDRAHTWLAALTLGAGHGGIESIIVGALVLLTFVNLVIARSVGAANLGLPIEQVALAEQQIAAYWGQTWHIPLAVAVERLTAITMHLALSVLVLQAFTRRNVLYYVGAVMWHAAVDAGSVLLVANKWGVWTIEGVLALTVIVNLGVIFAFRRSPYDREPEPPAVLPDLPPIEFKPRDHTNEDDLREQIERSKFDV